jgi:hypothetical protein
MSWCEERAGLGDEGDIGERDLSLCRLRDRVGVYEFGDKAEEVKYAGSSGSESDP